MLNYFSVFDIGGDDLNNPEEYGLKTTEFVSCHSPYPMDCESISRPGPELPVGFNAHCMSKIGNLVILSGALGSGLPTDNREVDTLVVDISKNFTMTYGPKMIESRFSHSCGSIYHNGKTYMIVSGGFSIDTDDELATTELWDPTSDEGWIKGKFGFSLIYLNRYH